MNLPWLESLPLLVDGLLITVQVAVLSSVVALALAAAAGLARTSRYAAIRGLAGTYVEIFRACSLLVLLFWVYFALPFLGIELSKVTAAVLAIGLNIGAYGAEIVRSSLKAIPEGQHEAGIALNLSPNERMLRIILPQAVARMLPPFGNLLIELLKSTSLVYFITLSDLTYEAMVIRNNYYTWTPHIFGSLLIIYFLLSSCIFITFRLLERKLTAWR
ncbi:ectoine/hydroxyectoine ABC transporter permease subunit EhuC [Paenibacillus arenilitoris]|uniref:Ectoine/hydroxyectoine ABC transporter permease subunit EhuC n=1 Tax=Paenibacillus arenilitoris TaxID=2772299 RepID=A0A927CLR6_9BACL|nr:ectoine/hydroxyectoine ABC transporter permease subunit EhuC [Paenibacillus arenilitoris]MBD2869745.1 ectoine/hydroxyectoine ABC transporter permease subunit EhuC [Paenibacillus arenilitoris]